MTNELENLILNCQLLEMKEKLSLLKILPLISETDKLILKDALKVSNSQFEYYLKSGIKFGGSDVLNQVRLITNSNNKIDIILNSNVDESYLNELDKLLS